MNKNDLIGKLSFIQGLIFREYLMSQSENLSNMWKDATTDLGKVIEVVASKKCCIYEEDKKK